MDQTYYNSPYYTPANNNYYWEPQPQPSIYIHPESPAEILGYTLEQLAPILRKQQQFLQDELAQPQPVLTRPTTTSYHRTTRIVTNPDPAFYTRPQQDAAQLGITSEELSSISEASIREQNEWLAQDEADWRGHEGERWRGKATTGRESGDQGDRKRTEEAKWQERDEMTQG
jgi:hypothetical protein